jgi:hypothetical protein
MSQENQPRTRRAARARRQRPVLVTEQELEQQAEEGSAIATESKVEDVAETKETVKPRRGLAGFFSTVGKNDESSEKKGVDVAQARLARATRGKVAEDKATTKSSETSTKETKDARPAASRTPQRPQSAFKMRYIFGMFIYLIVANFAGLYETTFMKNIGADYELTQVFGLQIRTSTLVFLATLVIILIILAKLDFLPTSLMGGTQNRAQQAKSQSTASSPKTPQPTTRQGVKGADDALYQQYRQAQRKKK